MSHEKILKTPFLFIQFNNIANEQQGRLYSSEKVQCN